MTGPDDLAEALRTQIRSAPAGSGDKDTKTGMLSGLLDNGSARVAPQPGETVYHHAGYLSGHLLRWLFDRGRVLDDPLRLIAAGYAASLADPGGQAMLDKPDRPMTAHSYAAIRCERTTDRTLSEADERLLFGWLVKQTGTPYTQTLDATFQRLRIRRHERLRLGGLR
jgi:hypothetical protein